MKKLSLALVSALAMTLSVAPAADAKFRGFGGGGFRTKSSFSRTYTAPKPSYRPAPSYRPTTTVNNTTVVQQKSGGGIFSNIAGTIAGMAIYDWLFDNDDEQQQQVPSVAPVPAPAPAQVPVN
ncbi:hypothetical protein [Sinorhizobium meliloti]|uniref:hypothetical protein n=1 Tax=Rhizobium meliloti TaxID=382 RepID=UPI0012A845F3|nr:hypothetical protein [Sinorhizobium meliloti]QGJ74051.1 hypothetical protein C3L21_08515 [Sinorhizobium meliloti]